MRTLFYRFLLLLVVAWTATAVVQAQSVASRYSATLSPFSYEAVSAANSSTFINLKTIGTYPNGPLYGDADDGICLIGNFGTPTIITPPFNFNFGIGGTEYAGAAAVGANGFYQTARGNVNASGTVFVDAINNPSGSGFYNNSAIQNYIFGFCGDLDLTAATSEWYYAVQGTAPNRRVIVEWRNAKIKNTTTTITFQIIVTETSNIIDVVYGPVSGAIPASAFYTGMNEGTAAFANTPAINAKTTNGQAGNYVASRFVNNNWETSSSVTNPYGSTGVWPTKNIRYCVKPTLNVSAPNMTLLDGAANVADRTNVGTPITRTYAFTNLSTSTTPVKVTASLSGAGAAHYTVSPTVVASLAPNASQTFTVTFNPTAFGDLGATLTLDMSTPDGATCPVVLPATSIVLNGRALGLTAVEALSVNFGATAINGTASRNVALFRNDATGPLTYRFTGPTPSSAQFNVTGSSGTPRILTGTVGAGDFVYLPVTFSPTYAGAQTATLDFYYSNVAGTVQSLHQTVSLSGEGTPSRLRFSKGGTTTHLGSGSLFAQSFFGAVGEEPLSFDFTLSNTGVGAPVTARDFEFYELDRENPISGRLRVMWTGGFGQGEPIASNDFRVQQYVNGQWVTVGDNDVVSVPAQQSQQMRVQFAPDRRGVNFVRMFFRSDATVDDVFNPVRALNAADVMTTGLQSYDFYGITARNSQIAAINPLLFMETEVGETTTASLQITNKGDSRLLIEQSSLKLIDGDKDFIIESAFAGMETENGKYVIPVNQTGEIVIRFTPKSKGTRLTTLYLMSNDSSEVAGVIGARYVPITGLGLARALISVTAQTESTPFAGDTTIVAVPTSYVDADVRIRNMGNSELNVTEVFLRGTNMADYTLLTPFTATRLQPGAEMMVTVRFAAQSGGRKSAELVVQSNAQNGDQVVDLSGFGGERLVAASSHAILLEDRIAVGEKRTGTVVIRNTGTVDLDLSAATLSGESAGDYTITSSNTDVRIAPNEFVTVTVELTSSERGTKKAILTMLNNSTNEPVVTVELGGFVGVRTASYTPQQISMSSVLLQDGTYESKQVCVTVTNTGDLPMTLTSISLSGAQASQYSHDGVSGTVIEVGETRDVCVTYRPTSSTAAVAELTIQTDGTPGTIIISINGMATSVGEASVAGYRLGAGAPSPAVTETVIGYELAMGGEVRMELYDASGRKVRTLAEGYRSAGTHEVSLSVVGLESGVYFYRLSINGHQLSQVLRIVK